MSRRGRRSEITLPNKRNANGSNESNSLSESRRFSGYGDYFARKKLKLQEQHAARWAETNAEARSQLFSGLRFGINGYTNPPYDELKDMLITHGGTFVQFVENKSSIDYLICTYLTPSKRIAWKNYKVVKPSWVVQSIEQQRILPWTDFRTVGLSSFQTTLQKYLPKAASSTNGAVDETSDERIDREEREEREEQNENVISSTPTTPTSPKPNTNPVPPKEQHITPRSDTSPQYPSVPSTPTVLNDPVVEPPTRLRHIAKHELDGLSDASLYNYRLLQNPNVYKSTAINPQFLSNYFSSSRLHHISMWKMKFRQEVQDLLRSKQKENGHQKRKVSKFSTRYLFHVDFDCFFASVLTRDRPELQGRPVAVAHGTKNSEIASCNYAARDFGVKNGMFVNTARSKCPELELVDYDFDAFESVARTFYQILSHIQHTAIKVVSVDEAVLDMTDIFTNDDEAIKTAESIQTSVLEQTRCTVSVGIGPNLLLARLALRKAKPRGIYLLNEAVAGDYLKTLTVRELPGVGWAQEQKLLLRYKVKTVSDLRSISRESLMKDFGASFGAHLYSIARGHDETLLKEDMIRSSISVDVNWGVRFIFKQDVVDFLGRLCEELVSRMRDCHSRLQQLQLRVLKRAKHASFETLKYLGCGEVDTLTKSAFFNEPTDDTALLTKKCVVLFHACSIDAGEIRGIGLQALKLSDSGTSSKQSLLKLPLLNKRLVKDTPIPSTLQVANTPLPTKTVSKLVTPIKKGPPDSPFRIPSTPIELPSPSQLDLEVLKELPTPLRDEIQRQAQAQKRSIYDIPTQLDSGFLQNIPTPIRNEVLEEHKRLHPPVLQLKSHKTPPAAKNVKQPLGATSNAFELMRRPAKRKQPLYEEVDPSVFQELPTPIRKEIKRDRNMQFRLPKTDTVAVPQHPVLSFQGAQTMTELRRLVCHWYKHCIRGPHQQDVDYFIKYVCKLITVEKNLAKAHMILHWFRHIVQPSQRWSKALEKVILAVQTECLARGVPPLMDS
ncbi:deoxycytidyl transferase Rev1 [Schizosaccharomyces japonicus yFS275]|uniref:DNA repair protein REV1 n=1 Tax=Schizosaccharomyces japonicus (strain yFS275 / FY16936) TaxID=402676 RepID=B6K5D4_SCHJY|nr:deoxycytidyl transferase Rev1 [Schizosaccharomyces japonicus yFS275]EEB08738.1 deoxycytidyl transferase Rev1 [Schizosaccharomyces japonicus yFS275]